jgi:hypothetical protein
MNNFEKTKAQEMLGLYLGLSEEDIKSHNNVLSKLEEINLNGREFIELIEQSLKENYVRKTDYDKLMERYSILKEREKY